jgi:hypothetical protein
MKGRMWKPTREATLNYGCHPRTTEHVEDGTAERFLRVAKPVGSIEPGKEGV